jgi:dihydroxyacetone kinase
MKSLINRPEDVVLESLEGLCETTPHLRRLDGYPAIKVCYDSRHDGDTTVSIISGGGSGHEPAFAGFVGKGMLAAAVAGDVFAAPPEEAILAAIRQVTGKAGCLIILNNYTGDRLNFGAAAERAKAEGISNIEMVIVADDCALPHRPLISRRGLAGSAFVLKAAGAVAAAGGDLRAVYVMAQHAANSVGTMGCALTTCNIPGHTSSTASSAPSRIGADEMEMGLGLHGEPGAYTSKVKPVDEIVTELVTRISLDSTGGGGGGGGDGRKTGTEEQNKDGSDIFAYLPIKPKEPIALLINNLGGVTLLEMGIVSRAVVRAVHAVLDATIERVVVGSVVTSLDMKGISVSILKLSGTDSGSTVDWGSSTAGLSLRDALDAETDAPGWPRQFGGYVVGKEATPVPHGPITDSRITTEGTGLDSTTTAAVEKNQNNGSQKEDKEENEEEEEVAVAVIRKCVEAACQALISSEAELNELDAKVGDGDCGSTLATGARAVLDALPSFQLNSAAATALSLANAIGLHVGGTSGGVFKIFFTSAAAALRTSKEETGNTSSGKNLTIESAAMALKAGVEAVMKYGGAERGYRTLVDALAPASDALSRFDAASSGEGAAAAAAAEAMAAAAEKGAEETKSMHALAGRSSYVPDAVLQGVPDPGAVGVARWMRAIAETLKQE